MKTIMKSIVCVFGGIMAISCTKYLEEDPKTSFKQQIVFSSDQYAWGAVNGAMSQFMRNDFYLLSQITSGYSGSTQTGVAPWQETQSMRVTIENPRLNNGWTEVYTSLNNINLCIESKDTPGMTDSLRQKFTGTAHFYRAYLLTLLTTHWGDVPMPLTGREMFLPRTRAFDIYTQILADLEVAEENLTTYKGEGNIYLQGMPSIYTVYGFRAKIYTYMACIAQYPGEPFNAEGFGPARDYWQLAYDNARYVYENGGYDLTNPRCAINKVFSYYNKYNPYESLWEITYSGAGGRGFFASIFMPNGDAYSYSNADLKSLSPPIPPDPMYQCRWTDLSLQGAVTANREHYCTQYLKYHNQPDSLYLNPQDSRLVFYYITNQWFSASGSSRLIFPNPSPSLEKTGTMIAPFSKKYLDPISTNSRDVSVNVIALRYADILLLLAEAANELDKSREEIIGYVNQVLTRARNNLPETDTWFTYTGQPANWSAADYPTKEEMRRAIMNERVYELGGEFHDFIDFRRHGLEMFKERLRLHNDMLRGTGTGSVMAKIGSLWDPLTGAPINPNRSFLLPGGTTGAGYPYPEDNDAGVKKAMLLPIPSAELNANTSITENNFGY